MADFVIAGHPPRGARPNPGQLYVISSRFVFRGHDPDDTPARVVVARGLGNLEAEIARLRAEPAANGTTYVHVEAAAKVGTVYVVDDGGE